MPRGINSKTGHPPNYKHGASKTQLYKTWSNMLYRCRHHKDYLGRGITVCDEWSDFEAFRDWSLKNGWKPNMDHWLSIDRIDNDKGYSPDNCRWTDPRTQANNTKKTRAVTAVGDDGTTLVFSSIHEACRFIGKSKSHAGNITRCCQGHLKKAYGYKWSYLLSE